MRVTLEEKIRRAKQARTVNDVFKAFYPPTPFKKFSKAKWRAFFLERGLPIPPSLRGRKGSP